MEQSEDIDTSSSQTDLHVQPDASSSSSSVDSDRKSEQQKYSFDMRTESEKILAQMNEEAQKTRAKLGPFIFRKKTPAYLQMRPVIEIKERESLYLGEWNPNTNLKEGKGAMSWSDGSIHEGYWKNNHANGEGRLIHWNGDLYEGYWVDDKCNG